MIHAMGFSPETAADGFEGLERFSEIYDAVLLNARMPGMDGYDTAARIRMRENGAHTPVVMLTDSAWARNHQRAEEAGVDGFLSKPVGLLELEECVKSTLETQPDRTKSGSKKTIQMSMSHNAPKMQTMTRELAEARRRTYHAQRETIRRLATAAEYRDEATGAHVRRIGEYCALIGKKLKLPPGKVEVLRYASQLHDVGKIGIPDEILLKPGRLNEDEWRYMKQHVSIGARILDGSSSKFLQRGKQIVETHHEKWDGSGYPDGLCGSEIPLFGRICAIADVFDALTTDRPYRAALSMDEAVKIMEKKRARHFDPKLLDIFLNNIDEVLQGEAHAQSKAAQDAVVS